jgi:hypothetical protein
MFVFLIIGAIISLIILIDFKKCRSGEAIYLKKYYPEIYNKVRQDRFKFGDEYYRYTSVL